MPARTKPARKQSARKALSTREITVTATEFKARCLSLMDDVGSGKLKRLIVSKRGKPVVQIGPVHGSAGQAIPFFGSMKGLITVNPEFDLTKPSWDVEELGAFPGEEMSDDFAAIAARLRRPER